MINFTTYLEKKLKEQFEAVLVVLNNPALSKAAGIHHNLTQAEIEGAFAGDKLPIAVDWANVLAQYAQRFKEAEAAKEVNRLKTRDLHDAFGGGNHPLPSQK